MRLPLKTDVCESAKAMEPHVVQNVWTDNRMLME